MYIDAYWWDLWHFSTFYQYISPGRRWLKTWIRLMHLSNQFSVVSVKWGIDTCDLNCQGMVSKSLFDLAHLGSISWDFHFCHWLILINLIASGVHCFHCRFPWVSMQRKSNKAPVHGCWHRAKLIVPPHLGSCHSKCYPTLITTSWVTPKAPTLGALRFFAMAVCLTEPTWNFSVSMRDILLGTWDAIRNSFLCPV